MISTIDMRTTIETVDFPIKNGDFPVRYVSLPEGNQHNQQNWLVVWNMIFIFPNSWDDDQIWQTHIFRGGWSHQPDW